MHAHPLPRRASICLVLLLALGAALPAKAAPKSILDDPAFQEDAMRGLDRLYMLDFTGAQAAFSTISARYPDHPVGPLLLALPDWWEIQLNPDDESRDKAFFDAMEQVLKRSDRRLKRNRGDLDALFFKAGAHAFRGRLYADRKHYLRAARDGQKALKYFQEVRKRDPNNPDLLLGAGLFDYLADVVPKQYPILKPFARLFPRGDKERGLRELHEAMERGRYVSTEASFSLLQIYYFFEKDYATSLHYARLLRERYPGNSVFHLFEGRAYARLNLWGEARRVLGEVAEKQASGENGYTGNVAEPAFYLLGRDGVRGKRYAEALEVLDRLEELPKTGKQESTYKVYGRLYRGMALDAMGQRQEALRWYQQVLAARGSGNDKARDQAKGFLKQPFQG
jgi:tetratricopeptide (TPR) repeat protein